MSKGVTDHSVEGNCGGCSFCGRWTTNVKQGFGAERLFLTLPISSSPVANIHLMFSLSLSVCVLCVCCTHVCTGKGQTTTLSVIPQVPTTFYFFLKKHCLSLA